MPAREPAGARLLAACGATVDRCALPVMTIVWLAGGRPDVPEGGARRSESFRFYARLGEGADARALFPEPPPPAIEVRRTRSIEGGRIERYRWHSGYRTWDRGYQSEYDSFRENATGCAEAWRHDGSGHPAILCLHSWATGNFRLQRLVYLARTLYRSGLDVLFPILPFHGPRTPRGSAFGGQLFPGTNARRTNEGFGQATWDVRALFSWLQGGGSGPIGVMGMSLGGYTAALLAAVDPRLAFSIPMIPMVSLADLLWRKGEGHPERRRAEAEGVTLGDLRAVYAVHAPLRYRPALPWARRMIVAGRGDRVCEPAHVEALWEHWERPRIHWFDGGHLTHFHRRAIFRDVRSFVGEALS
jgi:hypothetical protein